MADSAEVQAIVARGKITAEDVLKLRNRVFWKGVVTPKDAEMVFHLNDRLASAADPSWSLFFVEALTDYVVMQAEPQGYISDENAEWLIARISHSGHVDSENELELLVKALERAKQSPVGLVKFALEQVKLGVLDGSGVVGHKHRLEPGVVGEGEVELLRRILFAFGGDGNIAVTRQEAEVLFDINDATSEVDNHPAWSDLFVKAVANFLMATCGYEVPNRHEALRREAWLDAPSAGVGGFMSRMLAGSLDAVWEAYQHGTGEGEAKKPASPGLTIGDEPRASAEEVRWVADRMSRDGQLHANEMALINFLKSHRAHLHPKLNPILDRVAA
ncbi:MAG: hypothetical protein IT539_18770 [Bradyrhizobiaceae bacterium]|nr:hypothetical protein [Bradyrhizobiaceae bacterium]